MLEIPCKIEFNPKNVTTKHDKQSSWKKTVICNSGDDLEEYYAWFLKKRFNLIFNKPLRGSHITIINDKVDNIEAFNTAKEIWHGRDTIFTFEPDEIRSNGEHWWIKVYNDEVARIRTVAGLNPQPYFNLHLTIGLMNEKNIEHSKYILRQILEYGQ